jgi:hypothetical protein
LPFIDFVKIEFKTPDSQFIDPAHYSKLVQNSLQCLKISISTNKKTFIKIVVSSKTNLDQFKTLINDIFNTTSKEKLSGFIIQPTFGIAEPSLDKLLKFYDIVQPYYNEVRVIPQLHKIIGAP